jgi:hypothetical protein
MAVYKEGKRPRVLRARPGQEMAYFRKQGWKVTRAKRGRGKTGWKASKNGVTVTAPCSKSLCNRMAAKEVGFR